MEKVDDWLLEQLQIADPLVLGFLSDCALQSAQVRRGMG